MGWLVRYTGPEATVSVPGPNGMADTDVKQGDVFDLPPLFIRDLVADSDAPWERIMPYHDEYIAVEERHTTQALKTIKRRVKS